MKKSKKIFLLVALIFILLMLVIAYDISQRTTFPGQKPATEVESTERRVNE